jgi:hypothetical protein
MKDSKAREVFDSLMQIQVGDGRSVLFWRDRWMGVRGVQELAPTLIKRVKTRAYNARTVAQGLTENIWLLDLQGALSI